MTISKAHGFLLQGKFANGSETATSRTFLAIDVRDNILSLLNVSTIRGKEHKLGLKSNERLHIFIPPFKRPSFVKFDEVYEVEIFSELERAILAVGQTLDETEFKRIESLFNAYKENHRTITVRYLETYLKSRNPIFN